MAQRVKCIVLKCTLHIKTIELSLYFLYFYCFCPINILNLPLIELNVVFVVAAVVVIKV